MDTHGYPGGYTDLIFFPRATPGPSVSGSYIMIGHTNKDNYIIYKDLGNKLVCGIVIHRPNLRNLSRVLNLRRGSNIIGSTLNCIQCLEILAGTQ